MLLHILSEQVSQGCESLYSIDFLQEKHYFLFMIAGMSFFFLIFKSNFIYQKTIQNNRLHSFHNSTSKYDCFDRFSHTSTLTLIFFLQTMVFLFNRSSNVLKFVQTLSLFVSFRVTTHTRIQINNATNKYETLPCLLMCSKL